MADVAELIGEPLQLGAVLIHRQIALLQGAQLRLQLDGALQLIILEQVLDGVPQRERVVAITANNVEDGLVYGGEDPVDDACVNHAPLAVAIIIGRSRTDVALKAEFSEGRLEEETPLAVVGLVHVKDDRNVMADGNSLDLGGAGWSNGEAIIGGL